MINKKLIASAIVDCGYGTDEYDPATSECTHVAYCNLHNIVLNVDYWMSFFCDSVYLNEEVHRKFDLPWGFDRFRIDVYDDDSFDIVDAGVGKWP